MPDDVVIADIGGQALDIFLHGPESARKNGIVKTFTHTSILIQPCTLLKKERNKQNKNLNSPNMPSFTGPLPVQCTGGRRPGSLAPAPQDCSTSEALSPRTVLTENICESVQLILQHSPAIMPFLTTSTLTDPPMHTPKATKSKTLNSQNMTPSISCPVSVQCVGGRRPEI